MGEARVTDCGQSAVRMSSSESRKREERTEESRQHDGDGRGSHTNSTVLFTCNAKQNKSVSCTDRKKKKKQQRIGRLINFGTGKEEMRKGEIQGGRQIMQGYSRW